MGLYVGPEDADISPSPLLTVTRDLSSLMYRPANAAEWTTFLLAAGDSIGNPVGSRNFQEASGNFADSIGSVTLSAGTGQSYRQPVSGWSSFSAKLPDGGVNRIGNLTTAPNPATTSVMQCAYLDLPAAPAAIRDLMGVTTNVAVEYLTTGKLRLVGGTLVDTVNSYASTRTPVILRVNNTAATLTLFTDKEKLTGTYALPAASTLVSYGRIPVSGLCSAAGLIFDFEFTGAAAERSDAQIKTILLTAGFTVLWS